MIKIKKIKRFLSSFLASTLMVGMAVQASPITTNEVSGEEVKIISQYVEGEKMLPEQIEARKSKAEQLNLQEWVDENYFLVDDFYRDKSEANIEELGANILVNTVTNEELNSWASNLKNGISPATVTYYEKVSYGQSTVGKFEVDGKMAFCAEHSQTTPAKGSPTGQANLNNNDLVRKVLYYGYGGPGQLSDMTGNYGWVMTSLGLSKAYTGSGGTNATNFVNRVSALASPPSSFKVYVVQSNGGSTQDLAYWEYSPKGQLQIEKSSSNPEITNNNNYYSLEGAVYGVYQNSNATNEVATLTTNADGKSQVIELDESTYYIKEKTPPKGYALDNTIYSITVNSGILSVGKYVDRPLLDPVAILVKKVDADTGNSNPQGAGSLEGAEFTIKYYEGNYLDGVNPSDLGIQATRNWILRTDSDGFCALGYEYKVGGDSFYLNDYGAPSIPLGTITIQETKSPIGYLLNSEVFVRNIKLNSENTGILSYNAPIVKEEVIKGQIKVTKVDEETGAKLQGAEFELIDKESNEVIETLVTGADGTAISGLHPYAEYILRETKSPDKYTLNGQEYFVKISEHMQTIEVTHANRIIKGRVQVTKVDEETGEKLQGAEFELLDKTSGNVVETLVTGEDGTVTSGLHPYAEYILRETKAPDKYTLNGQEHLITINSDMQTIEVTHANRIIKGRVKVTKVDEETGAKLQGAEFELIDKESGNVVETLITGEDGAATSGLHPYAEYILRESKAPDKYTLNGQEHLITINSDMQTIEVTHENRIIKGYVEIQKSDSEIDGLNIEGAIFGIFNEEGNKVEELITDKNGYAKSGLLNWGNYTIKELSPANGYLPTDTEWKVEIREDGKVYSYDIENDIIRGKIQIVKIDSSNVEKPVQGATFNVVVADVFGIEAETIVDTITTDENGFAFTKDLRFGDYYLKEISVGEDYWLNGEKYPITISENEKIKVIRIKNDPVEMKLRVLKYDEDTKKAIKGTKFKVVNKETGEDIEFTEFFGIIPYKKTVYTTNNQGEIVFPQVLGYGKYQLVEVEPAEGYNAIAPIDFEITRDTNFEEIELLGKVTTVKVGNDKIDGEISIVKVDEKTREPLEGVEFEITAITGFNKGLTWNETTDKDGKILVNALYGKYEIREVAPLWNYVTNGEVFTVEITEEGQVIEIEVENKKIYGEVELIKKDSETGRLLEGVEFELYNGNKLVGTYTTDENGRIKVTGLEAGNYNFKEISNDGNYIITDETYYFEIKEDGQVIEIEALNEVKKTDLSIVKIDTDTKEIVPGAKLKIKGIEEWNNHIEVEIVTTEEPIVLNVPVGRYAVTEEEAPEGYHLSDELVIVTLVEDETAIVEFENDKIDGDILIVKVDTETKEPLAGVEFEITCIDGFDKGQTWIETTDDEGKILKNDLYGKYEVREVAPLWNYVTNGEVFTVEITEEGQAIEIEVENKKIYGEVELIKKDSETGRLLEGVEFELYNGNRFVGNYTTDENGRIKVTRLEAGNYNFKEISNDGNYIISDETYYFEIKEDGQVIEIEVLNDVKEGEVDFSKTDVSTGELIEGATIEINGLDDHNNHINIEFISTKEENRFKLPVGKYEFKETVAPEGFVLNEEVGYFEILEDEVIKAELKNKRIEGTLEFEKTDVSTGEVIEGAHIKIECVEGFNKGEVIEFVSSKEGNKIGLEYGKYVLSETLPPDGYELTTETGEFEITEDGQIVKAELKNKRIKVSLPQTGGRSATAVIGFALIISLAGVVIIRKKKAN